MTSSKEIILFYGRESTFENTSLGVKSSIKPVISASSDLFYLPPDSARIQQSSILYEKKTERINFHFSVTEMEVSSATYSLCFRGETYYFIAKQANSDFQLIEGGSLEFGMHFACALNSFYSSISYVPPHGIKGSIIGSLKESVAAAKDLVDLLTDINKECKECFSSINSFAGCEGAIPSNTLQCLQSTVKSWKALINRLTHFDTSLSDTH